MILFVNFCFYVSRLNIQLISIQIYHYNKIGLVFSRIQMKKKEDDFVNREVSIGLNSVWVLNYNISLKRRLGIIF